VSVDVVADVVVVCVELVLVLVLVVLVVFVGGVVVDVVVVVVVVVVVQSRAARSATVEAPWFRSLRNVGLSDPGRFETSVLSVPAAFAA
jgi:hypothetical protein